VELTPRGPVSACNGGLDVKPIYVIDFLINLELYSQATDLLPRPVTIYTMPYPRRVSEHRYRYPFVNQVSVSPS
jgi:hypothetical protein